MIGRFPWDPFPPGVPDPKGPDPLHAALYRAAVTGADGYRSVRLALRREGGVLRIGNRFVPDARYREVAFVAVGHAATSMGLAALDVFGDRLAQGFLAGPDGPVSALPFRGVRVTTGWGGAEEASVVVEATREIASGLGEADLLLLLVSPGALRALLLPPAGFTPAEFGQFLEEAHARGATGREVGLAARVLGDGGVGGRLLPADTKADVQTFVIDRGDGPHLVGGGPMTPVREEERGQVRSVVERLGLSEPLSPSARATVRAGTSLSDRSYRPAARTVVVSSPGDALRAAADLAFDKGWTARVAFLALADRPEVAADRLLETTEAFVGASRREAPARTKGVVAVGATTLDVPEGVDEQAACRTFLERVGAGLRRREMSVGVYRTAGPADDVSAAGGEVIGAATDPDAKVTPGNVRTLRMRQGITDVGIVLVAVVRAPDARVGPDDR